MGFDVFDVHQSTTVIFEVHLSDNWELLMVYY